jgi:mannose-6-phosphate isomerase-like protein (cupin superfamily)
MSFHITIEQAIRQLEKEKENRFTVLMKHGSMNIEYYAPEKPDNQTPHSQDEIYVVASGTAIFFRDGERVACKAGDVLFVPAKMEHRFENFSPDFATWVIFYGRDGGELQV